MACKALRGGGLAAALLLAGHLAQSQSPTTAAVQEPPRAAACMACHGPQGNSQVSSLPSIAGQPQVFIENQLVLIREGLRDVPAMKGLLEGVQDAEIVQLARFFAAQKPLPTAKGPPDEQVYRRGQALAARGLCGSCHLPDFSGRAQIPRLAGQHEEFLLQSLKQFRDHPGPGRDTIMAASLYGFKDDELADMAHFLAHFR
ncbi:c-type cytochrome [Ramlibacter sp.]|uniref:c-type cytochrome n=1 Tax=Ramlibacter sp. TaxID=1917967 RepID=UPI002FCBE1FC